jgi:hypothetical protein
MTEHNTPIVSILPHKFHEKYFKLYTQRAFSSPKLAICRIQSTQTDSFPNMIIGPGGSPSCGGQSMHS